MLFSLKPVALVHAVPAGPAVVAHFERTDLDATYTRLSDRGVAFYAAPGDQTWLWREAFLKDPDGKVLCLFQAGENRRCPPWRVASE